MMVCNKGPARLALSIYYDGDCPFCARYVGLVRLREAAGPVRLVDLRRDGASLQRFEDLGLAPDDGMVVETGDRLYHGADAMNVLSLMSTDNGLLNRASAALFRHKTLARILYPLLRAGRNATLFLLGREPFARPAAGEAELFLLVSRLFGLLTLLDVFIHVLRYKPLQPEWTSLPLAVFGLVLMLWPGLRQLFVATILLSAVDVWLHAPMFSNHAIMKTFLLLAMLAAGLWHWLAGHSFARWFADVRPVGRALLLVMYGFGIFHKINTDFLNPAVSCAVVLWQKMPAPLAALDGPALHTLAIYGTFATEGLVALMLLVPRMRPVAIAIGIGFHALLALSNHAMYVTFSTLAIVLHLLFLSPAAALAITRSKGWQKLDMALRRPPVVVMLLLVLATLALAALLRDYSLTGLIWLALLAAPLFIILRHGRAPEVAPVPVLWSRLLPLNLVSLAFFLNCLSPYLGLKTAQSLNMFSNLRIEAGHSNHLLMTGPPGPFANLDDLVVIEAAQGAPYLEHLAETRNEGLVYPHFLAILAAQPAAQVRYTLNGAAKDLRSGAEILAEDGDRLPPPWLRKYLHHRPVPLQRPVPCGDL